MKLYNPLITILLALNIVSCGDSQKDKENYFSFDENNLKPIYQATDKVDFSLLNTKNKSIDSVAYFVNDKRISSVKGNSKFVLDLSGKNADDRPYSSLQTDPHSVRSNHNPTSPMLLVLNSVLCIIDLHLMTGSISVRRRGVGLSDYSKPKGVVGKSLDRAYLRFYLK